jgi:hypothetical protein
MIHNITMAACRGPTLEQSTLTNTLSLYMDTLSTTLSK